MTPTQPIPGTLLAAFTRFQQLSCYWQRQHTTPELAMSEMTEYISLSRSIPELIKRLTAFADVGTSHLFDVAARVKAEPPREDAGQGWRMLRAGEDINEGDLCGSDLTGWAPTNRWGGVVTEFDEGHYRRRIAKDTPKDTAGHIRADFEPNEALDGKESQETASEEAWRMLEANEEIMEGDEWFKGGDTWMPVSSSIGTPLFRGFEGMCRRRVTPPSPAKE